VGDTSARSESAGDDGRAEGRMQALGKDAKEGADGCNNGE
jgi:hypothetical protein